jgi:hypothetical protein
MHRTAPHRTAPHRTAPHRTAPHRTAPRHDAIKWCAAILIITLFVNLGYVLYENTPRVTHTFLLKNTSNVLLKILNISRSCTCTSAHIDRMSISPGAVAKVTVTINVPRTMIDFQAFCTIETDSVVQRDLVYSLRFTSLPGSMVEPSKTSISRKDFAESNYVMKRIKCITFGSSQPRDLGALKASGLEGVSVAGLDNLTPVDLGNHIFKQVYNVNIQVNKIAYDSNVGADRVIELTADEGARFTLPLEFERLEEVEIYPSVVNFGVLQYPNSATRFVRVKTTRDTARGVIVIPDSSVVTAEVVKEANQSESIRIKFTLDSRSVARDKPSSLSTLAGRVRLRLGDDAIAQIPWAALLRDADMSK